MYSGEYDACDVTLSVYPHRASLKNMPDHGGNRTYELRHCKQRISFISLLICRYENIGTKIYLIQTHSIIKLEVYCSFILYIFDNFLCIFNSFALQAIFDI
jgi:hypothetical protein